jgi:hypothetical protein
VAITGASRWRLRARSCLVVGVTLVVASCTSASNGDSSRQASAPAPETSLTSPPASSVTAASSAPMTSTAPVSPESSAAPAPGRLSRVPLSPDELAVALDGSLYIADPIQNVIYMRTASGVFSVVAGTGVAGFTGDGGPAASAAIDDPGGMLVEPDGTLLFADGMNNRLRAVSPNGRISTVAGDGQVAPVTTPGSASAEPVAGPKDVAAVPAGGYDIATDSQVLHVGATGHLTVVAGNSPLDGLAGIGGPALTGSVDGPVAIAVDSAGGVYVAGQNTKTLLYITATGTLTKVSNSFYDRGRGGVRAAPDGSVIAINTLELMRYRKTMATTIYDFGSSAVPGLHDMGLNGLAVSSTGDIYLSSDGHSGLNTTPTLARIDTHGNPTILWTGTPS